METEYNKEVAYMMISLVSAIKTKNNLDEEIYFLRDKIYKQGINKKDNIEITPLEAIYIIINSLNYELNKKKPKTGSSQYLTKIRQNAAKKNSTNAKHPRFPSSAERRRNYGWRMESVSFSYSISLSSHILSELENTAHRFGIVHDGVIKREITRDEMNRQNKTVCIEIGDSDSDKAKALLEQNGIEIYDIARKDSSLEEFYFGLVGGENNA